MKTFDIRWDSTDLPNPNIGEHLPPSKRIWNTLIEYYYCDCEGSDKGLPPKLSSREYYKNGKLIYTKYYKNRSSLKSVRIKKSKLLHKLREE